MFLKWQLLLLRLHYLHLHAFAPRWSVHLLYHCFYCYPSLALELSFSSIPYSDWTEDPLSGISQDFSGRQGLLICSACALRSCCVLNLCGIQSAIVGLPSQPKKSPCVIYSLCQFLYLQRTLVNTAGS